MPSFSHDGITFHYGKIGKGEPFIFQHGLGGDINQPLLLMEPPPQFSLMAFDCRGHGLTTPLGDPEKVSIPGYANDLLAFLDHLQLEQAIIGGISMGAAISLNMALRHPERVKGLVLSRPAWMDGPNPWNVRMFGLIADLLKTYGPQKGLEIFLITPEYKDALLNYPDVARSMALQFQNPRALDNVENLRRIPNGRPAESLAQLKQINVPVLVMANKFDPIHPFEYGEGLARAIPNARFVEITSKSISFEKHVFDVQNALNQFFADNFVAKEKEVGI